jgi:murein DD-endopeptidase MepM/ murein hydrolase activator NlpD
MMIQSLSFFLRYENLSEFWNKIDELDQIRRVIGNEVDSLVSQKILLNQKQDATTEKRTNLVELREQYSDQNEVLVGNKTEKSKLLSATKSEEAEYQKLLKDREAARALILKELRDFESKLQFILDPNTIPPKGTAVFGWPVQNVIITQLFGGTEFAKQNASVYGGRAYHPGVDFGVPTGTKIYAPLGGTVRATGNTDAVPGCYSWGKWTLIDHPNGLSTLYAHQSVQSVTPGQQVSTGEVIGYSGSTGYSTGPHLHFTVYAKAGVSVRQFNEIKAVTSCGAATTPVAATDAYIDPMVYLPTPP